MNKSKPYKHWLSQDIKSEMKKPKKLYDKAKRTQLPEDWRAYRLTRNTVNVLLNTAHKNYCANLFTESFQNNNNKQFWSYIKRIQKDHSSVSSLTVDSGY